MVLVRSLSSEFITIENLGVAVEDRGYGWRKLFSIWFSVPENAKFMTLLAAIAKAIKDPHPA